MTRFLLIITCCLLFGNIACKKDKKIGDEFVTLSYQETQCADKWSHGTTDAQTFQNLAVYLNSKQLFFAGLNIKQVHSPMACNACTCTTGRVVEVITFPTMVDQYAAIGFTK